jgi:pyruvate dehydrogenase E1 component beta subunit
MVVELNMVEAVRNALSDAMRKDPSVIVLGEDVGPDGGVFRATDGLFKEFGPERVLDTPLSEALFAGLALGAASQGFKPVVEFQFMGFMLPALDQLVNHLGRLRNRTRGRLSCPLVLRAPYGGGIHAPEHHSESMEAMFAHIPGIRLVIPSTPSLAYHLLRQAIDDPDPVVFLEPKRIYRLHHEILSKQAPAQDQPIVERAGTDLTLVSWGAMLKECREVTEKLAKEGVSVELVDLVTLKPLDHKPIIESVQRTGRCVIVHEAPLTGGFGAEIAACLAEEALTSLLAPVRRVAGFDTVMPLPRLEKKYMPGTERILEAINEVLKWR